MTPPSKKLPPKINDYIRKHFKGEFLFKVNSVNKKGSHTVYTLDIAKDEHVYHLKFDEKGWLMRKEVEEAFPAAGYEDPGLGDSPEERIFKM
jgi:hypothetical protein